MLASTPYVWITTKKPMLTSGGRDLTDRDLLGRDLLGRHLTKQNPKIDWEQFEIRPTTQRMLNPSSTWFRKSAPRRLQVGEQKNGTEVGRLLAFGI